jgi:hypothetical protein
MENTIKTKLGEAVCGSVDCIKLAQDSVSDKTVHASNVVKFSFLLWFTSVSSVSRCGNILKHRLSIYT